jgi:hypothetical protein
MVANCSGLAALIAVPSSFGVQPIADVALFTVNSEIATVP